MPLALLAGFVLLIVLDVVLRLRRRNASAHELEAEELRARYGGRSKRAPTAPPEPSRPSGAQIPSDRGRTDISQAP